MRCLRGRRTLALLAAFALVAITAPRVVVAAEDDDLFGSDDLGAGAELDPEIDTQIVALLKKARRLLDRRKYPEARALIEEADDLAPMDERVLDLLDVVGQLESEEVGARKVLAEIEAEQSAKEKEAKKEGQGLKAILARHHLPRALPKATSRLAKKIDTTQARLETAQKARDKCLAGATLSHAAAGARQCRPMEEKLGAVRKEVRALEGDLNALDEAFARRKGKKALARLKKQQKR